MPRLSPKERVSRRYKEHLDSLTEGEHSHERPPSFFPVRQERVTAGGVLCYILRHVCGHSLKKARALPLERNHQASAADGLRMYGNRYSLCLPAARNNRFRNISVRVFLSVRWTTALAAGRTPLSSGILTLPPERIGTERRCLLRFIRTMVFIRAIR